MSKEAKYLNIQLWRSEHWNVFYLIGAAILRTSMPLNKFLFLPNAGKAKVADLDFFFVLIDQYVIDFQIPVNHSTLVYAGERR